MELIKQFFADASTLLQEHRDTLRRWGAVLACLVLLTVVGLNVYGATARADEHSQVWELVIASRLFLFRLVAAVGTVVVGMTLIMIALNWLDNTKLGARLLHPGGSETDPAAHLRNLATVFLGLCVLVGLIFSGVPR